MLKLIRNVFNLWRSNELPEPKAGGIYSYDVVMTDGLWTYEGYYSFPGEIFIAYDKVIPLPIIKWKYAKNGK